MNPPQPKIVLLVISILGLLSLIGVTSLSLTMFFRNYADPAVLTAMISITSSLVGSLGTILVSTRPRSAGNESTPVNVTNPPSEPVPVETQ